MCLLCPRDILNWLKRACVRVRVVLGFAFGLARQLQVLSFPGQSLREFYHDLYLRFV